MVEIDTSRLVCCVNTLILRTLRLVEFSILQRIIISIFSGRRVLAACSYRNSVLVTLIICIFDLLSGKANDHLDDGIKKLGHAFTDVVC